jgi:peroxiredoxin
MIQAGDRAPDFQLPAIINNRKIEMGRVTLREYNTRGQVVLLVFLRHLG